MSIMNRKFYEIPKNWLLLVAALVWMLAGFNVCRLGILSYFNIEVQWYFYLLSFVVFSLFGAMFYKISVKHIKRIINYKNKYQAIWKFFDIKGYIIMAIMMGGGISLREFKIVPDWFVAFFYTGLGFALFLAGVLFFVKFILQQNKLK